MILYFEFTCSGKILAGLYYYTVFKYQVNAELCKREDYHS